MLHPVEKNGAPYEDYECEEEFEQELVHFTSNFTHSLATVE
jgi:hypothetical protein